MDLQYRHGNEIEIEFEFWPVEHPMEPPDEDQPVKCPLLAPSSAIKDGKMKEESLGRRTEQPDMMNIAGNRVIKRPVRTVLRKRQHTPTPDDNSMKPPARMPPLPTQNITIFQMLQEIDKFESCNR